MVGLKEITMTAKKAIPTISKKEEKIQRILGTLPKFMVDVSAERKRLTFCKVYVFAATETEAKLRALEILNTDTPIDDTETLISWATNDDETVTNKKTITATPINDDNYRAYRFKKAP